MITMTTTTITKIYIYKVSKYVYLNFLQLYGIAVFVLYHGLIASILVCQSSLFFVSFHSELSYVHPLWLLCCMRSPSMVYRDFKLKAVEWDCQKHITDFRAHDIQTISACQVEFNAHVTSHMFLFKQ